MSETNELSGLALREAVAVRVMGFCDVRRWTDSSDKILLYTHHSAIGSVECNVPAYESDPAACAAMEARIKELGLEVWYAKQLLVEVRGGTDEAWAHIAVKLQRGLDAHDLRDCIFATPEQRCRAALAAMEGNR